MWQPIETAPRDGEWFLGGGYWGDFWKCMTCSYQRIGGCCYLIIGDNGGWYSFADDELDPPTHWQPLPPPPMTAQAEGAG